MFPLPTFDTERARQLPRRPVSPNNTGSNRDLHQCLNPVNNSIYLEKSVELKTPQDGILELHVTLKQRESEAPKCGELVLPEYLQILLAGSGECGDSYSLFSKPDWLDVDKFRRGQRFALNNIFGVMYCELISLLMLFSFKGSLEPLIFTGKSDTPFKAFTRYLSTVTRVKSWYEGDIWNEDSLAHKNLKTVRDMHDLVRKRMENCPQEILTDKVKLFDGTGGSPVRSNQHDDIADDFRSSCPFLTSPICCSKPVYMNQNDMAITQFGFAGLLLLFPDKFGIHGASNDDLEGFAHFWRTIGHLLGIEDRYNLCDGDLETVQQRCRDLIEHWVRPSFKTISPDWLHMSRCVFDGLNYFLPCSTFEVILLYLCKVLEISAPKLESSLSIVQYCIYKYSVLLYSFLTHLPGVWTFHNWLIHFSMQVYKIVDSRSS